MEKPEHEREMLEEEKPGIIARLVGKEKKHIKPEVREKKMTKLNEKLHDSPRTTKNLDIKILVVEDNDLIQQVMGRLLTKIGYPNIVFASNGEEGFEKFQSELPNIIFLDLFMPVMDGGECCAKIRSLKTGTNVPIIGVTAHDDKDEVGDFLDNGMNGVLTKPVGVKQLKRVMNRFTGDAAGKAVYTKQNWMAVVSSKKPPPERTRVLVTEDNQMIQAVMKSLLNRLKYKNVHFCSNGKEAIAALEEDDYDIIFMDLYMPECDGVEATAEIRKMKMGANIPIIACTGHAIESDAKLCVEYGMNDLILKPVTMNSLITILRRYGFQAQAPKKKKKQGELMRDSSFISMTGLGRQRAISQSEFREMTPAGTSLPQPLSSVEDLQPIMPEESEFALCTLRRQDAISSAKFPEMKDPSEDDRIDLTGVRLTTRCPAEDDEEADTITFTPENSKDIRSYFRRQSSIFIEGVLKKVKEGGEEFEEDIDYSDDRVDEPFSLQNIMMREDLSSNSKMDLIWKDYELTEGSFIACGMSSDEEPEELE
eukprot:CAMPEP_0201490676 /NCGR_PEP_ID=MMETSP0151_2-20130828/26963_1 /ASSEMBLY_ACC=CAM_ASM_000257 /TAXON_ID=200890 /ORGANISM="Paramoeba atlantica, Strain 621/1 / CCAP 1560/9" /LENGTH=537 /DNA_ID=CAMNT_0047876717 /DNA_START=253 /DNA_END=1866 /DNA_ORIENTATION=+